jgi:hypothetical protein
MVWWCLVLCAPLWIWAQDHMIKEMKYRPFKEGDKFWLEGTHLKLPYKTMKLTPRWYGQFHITTKISDVTYHLKIPDKWKIHNVFHASLPMPYNETEKHSLNFLEPPPDLIDGEEEWEIEEILGDWHYWHKKQYLVWWKGYALAHDSWVDESELHVPELLEAYKNKIVRKILTNPAQLTMADIPQPAQIPHDQSSPVLHQSAVAQVPQDQSLWETGLQKYYELLSIRTLQLEDKETSSPTSFSTGRRSLFPRWAPSLLPPFRTVSSSTQQIWPQQNHSTFGPCSNSTHILLMLFTSIALDAALTYVLPTPSYIGSVVTRDIVSTTTNCRITCRASWTSITSCATIVFASFPFAMLWPGN